MIQVKRLHMLSRAEFEGLKGTELYAKLVTNKYEVRVPRSLQGLELVNWQGHICGLVENNCTNPWHVAAIERSSDLLFYFSSEDDACFLEKDVLKCTSEKDGE